MKQLLKYCIVILCITAAIAGCCISEKKETGAFSDRMRISLILPHCDYSYWATLGNGLCDRAADLGLDVKTYIPNLNYNVELITELILQQVATQVDAIVVQGIDDPGYIAALQSAQEAGIQIALVDTNLQNFQADLYIGTDNYKAGQVMGEKLIELTGGNSQSVVISGAPNYPNLEQRIQGIQNVIQSYPNIQLERVEYCQYEPIEIMECYHRIARESPQIDTLICVEGTGGQTLGQTDRRMFRHIIGFDDTVDTLSGIRNGIIDGVIVQQNYEMGSICAEQLSKWWHTGSYDQSVIYTSVGWITAEELDSNDEHK